MSGTEERRRRMRGAVLLIYEKAAMVAVIVVSLVTNPIFVVARNVWKDMFGGCLDVCVCVCSCVFVFQKIKNDYYEAARRARSSETTLNRDCTV